jgi:hypothetical protein
MMEFSFTEEECLIPQEDIALQNAFVKKLN